MKPDRRSALVASLIVLVAALFCVAGQARTDDFHDTVAEATEAAVEICQSPPMNQSSQSKSLSANGSAALDGFLKRMLSVGADTSGQIKESSSYGILQEDLANAIANGNDCRLKALSELLSFANSQKEAIPPSSVDPDGVYQFGQEIGKIQDASTINQGTVTFGLIQATPAFDPNQPFSYRNMKLKISHFDVFSSIGGIGDLNPSQSFGNVTCILLN